MFTIDRELLLIKRAQQGDKEAINYIIEEHTPLVKRIVGHVLKNKHLNTLEFEDLVQEGRSSLLIAIRKFDPTKNTKFSTYASYWIRQSITRRIVYEDNYLKRPAWTWQFYNNIHQYITEYQILNGHEPTIEEIAEHFGATIDKIMDVMRIYKTSFSSIDNALTTTSDTEFVDLICDNDTWLEDVGILEDIRNTLTEQEWEVFALVHGIDTGCDCTIEDAAHELHIPRAQASSQYESAKNKVRDLLISYELADNLVDIKRPKNPAI